MGNACFGGDNGGSHENKSKKKLVEDSLQNNMLRERVSEDVFAQYEVSKVLGEGSMGSVSMARRKESAIGGSAYKDTERKGWWCFEQRKRRSVPAGEQRLASTQQYALKSIILGRVSDEFLNELRNEIDILRALDHPNIVKAYEVYENRRQIYIVMELCSGGDLFARQPYSEKQAAKIVGKLLSAIAFMHANNVVHRDLKFENIMFENNKQEAEIKVIDFGLSKKYLPGHEFMTEGVGTIYTMAPQVFQGVYTSKVDMWSIGVIAYMLLSGRKPFYDHKRRKLIDKIMRAKYNFDHVVWEQISPEAQTFVSALIKLDPRERLSADQALQHAWLQNEFRLSDRRPPREVMEDVEGGLAGYKETGDFKKIALMVIAHKSSTDEIFQLRQAFDQYDTSNDGRISINEFKEAMSKSNYSDQELDAIFDSMDHHKNGYIEYTEFLAATIEARGRIEEERLAEAFDLMDSDDKGFIAPENLMELLGKECTPEQAKKLVAEVDVDQDGLISFQEFLGAFRRNASSQSMSMIASSPQVTGHDEESTSHTLLGIDAFIPGGKYDTSANRGE